MKRIFSLMLALLLIITTLPLSASVAIAGADQQALILPASLQEISEQAFAGNTAIKTLVIPNSVTTIGSEAFEGCTGITEVTVASRKIKIAKNAFDNCSRNIVFYAHNDSEAMVWAIAHGYKCISLDDDTDHLTRFSELVAHSGFDPSLLMSNSYASKCLIVRTPNSMDRLPDISSYDPVDIFRSDDHLYYIQFDTEGDTEDCFAFLNGNSGIKAEPDRIGANDDVSAQGVTIAENWGTNDTMGFDVYAPFVAQNYNGSSVTVAVIDSGVSQSSWGGSFSGKSASFVGGSPYTDSARHGSKVASILNDCLGSNKSHVTLMPIKVVNSSSMYRTSVIIEAIKHAASNGANIINMSLGWDISEGTSPEIEHQLSVANQKGILIVAAAGNGSGSVMYPASCDGVIAVSALAYSSSAGYSVRSRTGSAVDYTAPGMHLTTSAYSSIDGAGDVLGAASTSFAAPQITAALALIKLDATRSGNAVSWLNTCCNNLEDEGLAGNAVGYGLPELGKLGIIKVTDITPRNLDSNDIPSRLWLADTDNDFMLGWNIIPANASDKTVSVQTSNPSVVSVRQYGNSSALITAKGKGNATVTVTCGEISKEINLVVKKPVTEILLTGSDGTMIVNKGLDLAAAVYPEDADNRVVYWRSSDTSIVEVSQTGHVTAKAPGTATITCEAADGYGTKATLDMTVILRPDPEEITLSVEEKDIVDGSIELEVGETATLVTSILPEDALQDWRYSVYPKNVVTVSDDGIIEALPEGANKTTTIMATATEASNVYAGLSVSVVIYPTSITISADRTTLDIGETTILSAEVLPDNTTDKYAVVTWESRSPSIATVNSKTGLVRAVAPGTAEIVCSTPTGIEESITITVREPITITFDANGGTCTEETRTAYNGYSIGVLPTVSRTYYIANGWWTAKEGGTRVSSSSVFTESTTLYAHWVGKPYTVAFDGNGGSCETTTLSATVGTRLGALPAATREYYGFAGWFTAADGGTEVTPDYVQYNDSNLTVYAHWSNNPYTVRFMPNGGICDTEQKTATVDSPIGVLPTPTRAYYTWDGWFTSGGTEITSEYTQSTTEELIVYAHWTPMTYVMTFNANGGSCTTSQKTYTVDTEIGEPPAPSRSYYDFEGWYIEGDSPIHVTSHYQQATTATVTATARWTPHTYTMSFDANGGNCSTSDKIGTVDAAFGTLPVPTRNYYDFAGWYTAASGGDTVDASYVQSTDSNITVYAHWTAHKYTMTFDANGGTCDTSSKQGTVDVAIGTLPTPTRSYYAFDGWFTAKSGGTKITSTYVQKTDSAITVYAHWIPGTYTITLNVNGGSCSTASLTGTVDVAVGTLPTPTRSYYTFNGWYTAKSGGTKITSSYSQGTTSNITIYAQWSPMSYSMIFDGNGTGATVPSPSTRTYYVDTAVGSLPTPTRQYYDFDGWYTAKTGGTKITTSYAHTTTNSITVYAHWIPNTFKVNLNPGGGTCSTASLTCSVDTAIGTIPTPTRNYYTFKGWFTAASGGTQVTASTKYSTDSTVTIYAQWTEHSWSSWYEQGTVTIPSGAATETKTQYRYRDMTFSEWSAWGAWSKTSHTISNSLLEEQGTATIYPWYYYKCPNCGYHNKLTQTNCSSCKKYYTGGWNGPIWTTQKWTVSSQANNSTGDNAKVKYTETEYGYGILWSYSNHQGTGVTNSAAGYRYRTRTSSWGSWSSWSDSAATASTTKEVQTRTMIRYKEK